MEKKELTYIDLFAGCGGLSLGLNRAGWKGLFAIEKSPYAFSTLKHNLIDNLNHFLWPDWIEKKNYDINEILNTKKNNLRSLRGSVDMVVGGPPCQGFSSAGQRVETDNRNTLIKSYINFIRLVQPKIIFFENVKGFTQRFEKYKSKGKKYSEYVQACLKRKGKDYLGYEVFGQLVNFAEYGIPQKRTRFILVGIRKDLFQKQAINPAIFFDLIKSNREAFLVNKGIGLNQNIEDAISDLLVNSKTTDCPDSKGFLSGFYSDAKTPYQTFLRKSLINASNIPDSHRLAYHSEQTTALFKTLIKKAPKGKRLEDEDKIKFDIKKRGIIVLDKNNPSPTLTSHPDDYVHYCEPRILTVREYARIQTFPDWYQFREKYTTGGKLRKVEVPRYTQIGNAIPPLFGELSGIALQEIFK
jgi:DNA (cytosine-5)-methyltransferase 1